MSAAAERAQDLIIDLVTEGLKPAQEQELHDLLPRCPELDIESFELAAAAIDLACLEEVREPAPKQVQLRLVKQAQEIFQQDAEPNAGPVINFSAPEPLPRAEPAPSTAQSSRAGWWVAAACFLLAVAGWWRATVEPSPEPQIQAEIPTASAEVSELGIAEARADLGTKADDLIRITWTATEDPSALGAAGEVIWSTAEQTGYMHFVGLAANDPAVEQYQLWIFDSTQDERYPVDGGVFNVAADGDTLVKIDAKLAIAAPTLFAITVEKPGGVVVSDRKRLPLLASVG